MSERIVIDPITRIEGHLRVEAEIEGGTIKNAYSSGTMVRGIENIVKELNQFENVNIELQQNELIVK